MTQCWLCGRAMQRSNALSTRAICQRAGCRPEREEHVRRMVSDRADHAKIIYRLEGNL